MSARPSRIAHGRKHDAVSIQKMLRHEIKQSGKSSAEVAAEMQSLLGIAVTDRMLASFTAWSKELHRWPAEFDIAFCEVVGSHRLLGERLKRAGFRMVGPNEERLIAIGKAWEQKRRAEAILAGVDQ